MDEADYQCFYDSLIAYGMPINNVLSIISAARSSITIQELLRDYARAQNEVSNILYVIERKIGFE
jgi:hypothetical protein